MRYFFHVAVERVEHVCACCEIAFWLLLAKEEEEAL